MPWLAAATVAAPIVGGLVGNLMSQKDKAAQKKAMKRAFAELEKVGYPPDLSKELVVKEFQRQGIYTPELEQDLSDSFEESQVAKIQEDPELREAQKQALTSMQQRAKVGLSAEDRAALNQVRSEVQRDAEAKRQQVLQQMQSRGMGGSGAELMAQLQAGQSGAELASQQSDTLMAQAQQRALQALGQSSEMATQQRGQEFDIAQAKAQALDERNRFLQENSIARQRANVQSLNQAQQMNLAEQQRLHEANIERQRQEQLRQTQEQGSLYDRSLGYGQAKASALTGQAQQSGQQAQATAQGYTQMGSGLGSAAGAIGSANKDSTFGQMFSDEDLKENVDETGDEVNSFLERIAKKYK